jgi:hypothetical protein
MQLSAEFFTPHEDDLLFNFERVLLLKRVNNTRLHARMFLANRSGNDLLITSTGCADNLRTGPKVGTCSRLFELVGALFEDDFDKAM